MKCQTIFLKWFLGLKGVVYYEAIAMVIFSHVKVTCYFLMWRYQAFAQKLTWYFIGVYIIKLIIIIIKTKTFNKIENIMNAGFFLKLAKKSIPSGKKQCFLIAKISSRKNTKNRQSAKINSRQKFSSLGGGSQIFYEWYQWRDNKSMDDKA